MQWMTKQIVAIGEDFHSQVGDVKVRTTLYKVLVHLLVYILILVHLLVYILHHLFHLFLLYLLYLHLDLRTLFLRVGNPVETEGNDCRM